MVSEKKFLLKLQNFQHSSVLSFPSELVFSSGLSSLSGADDSESRRSPLLFYFSVLLSSFMDPEGSNLEERLKSLIDQLQIESQILDRIIYKNKNQHRRCSYFQYLMKVKRDVRLLISANLEESLSFLFQIINGRKPVKTVHLLESMKKRKCTGGRQDHQERLLGVARLLSQMVEPMVKAAIETSSLLGRSFFMGLSLIILALLARLRVLVQEILVDVVSVYNNVSSLSQKKQCFKLNGEGIEVFREYYPSNKGVITLECVWETDKFVLLEKENKMNTEIPDKDVGVGTEMSTIKYQAIEAFLGVDELGCQTIDEDCSLKDLTGAIDTKRQRSDVSDQPMTINRTQVGIDEDVSPNKNVAEGELIVCQNPLPSPNSQNLETKSRKVAFVAVSAPAQVIKPVLPEKAAAADWLSRTTGDKENPFVSLLTGENIKDNSRF